MLKRTLRQIENYRTELQITLDAAKSAKERNRLGQFSTPTPLARAIAARALSLLPAGDPVRFLDCAFGLGVKYESVLAESAGRSIQSATGIEIDPHYANPAKYLWRGTPVNIIEGDFTKLAPPSRNEDRANLLICNPPYSRSNHILAADKCRMQKRIERTLGSRFSGLSGLHAYFMGLAHEWMCDGAIAAWVIPAEFMDVLYGRAMKDYLLKEVTLLQIHRFSLLGDRFL